MNDLNWFRCRELFDNTSHTGFLSQSRTQDGVQSISKGNASRRNYCSNCSCRWKRVFSASLCVRSTLWLRQWKGPWNFRSCPNGREWFLRTDELASDVTFADSTGELLLGIHFCQSIFAAHRLRTCQADRNILGLIATIQDRDDVSLEENKREEMQDFADRNLNGPTGWDRAS